MRAAHAMGCRCLPEYSSKFSRHDYTLPQLFGGHKGVILIYVLRAEPFCPVKALSRPSDSTDFTRRAIPRHRVDGRIKKVGADQEGRESFKK